jgi:mono/diheme cytochrome c family protein
MKLILSFLFISSIILSASAQSSALKSSVTRGKEIYTDFCVSCHLPNGAGVRKVYPPLAKSDYLLKKRIESIKAIKFGLKGEIIVNGEKYNNVMAPLGLSDDEVADVMNYITNSWGNTYEKMVTEEEVSKIKK